MKVQGGGALSLNALIFRGYEVLLSYLPCGARAERIFAG